MLGITPTEEPIAPALEDLIVVFTHNQNDQFYKHTTKHINHLTTNVLYLNQNKEFNKANKAASAELITKFYEEMRNNSYQSVTFLIDFNLGYSGDDVCPVKEIVDTLEKEASKKYVFINDFSRMLGAKSEGKIPFRFMLTGGGGVDVSSAPEGLEKLSIVSAREKYGYMQWEFNKFIASLRQPGASPDPVTPQSSKRRLSNTVLNRSDSNGSPSSRVSSPSPTLPSPTAISEEGQIRIARNLFQSMTIAPVDFAHLVTAPSLTNRSYSENGKATDDEFPPENDTDFSVSMKPLNDENQPMTPTDSSTSRYTRPGKIKTPDRNETTESRAVYRRLGNN